MANINIAAAASLKNGLPDIIDTFKAENPGDTVTVTFSGSYALADQIVTTGNNTFNVYLSASDENDDEGMAKVVDAGKDATDPVQFIANSLVLIKNAAGVTSLTNITSFQTTTLANITAKGGHIWIADPTKAPAGMYAENAVELTTSTTNWTDLLAKATADGTLGSDVQATLDGLAADSTPAVGMVYNTDLLNFAPPSAAPTFVSFAPLAVNTTVIYTGVALNNSTSDVIDAAEAFMTTLTANLNLLTAKQFRLVGSNAPGV